MYRVQRFEFSSANLYLGLRRSPRSRGKSLARRRGVVDDDDDDAEDARDKTYQPPRKAPNEDSDEDIETIFDDDGEEQVSVSDFHVELVRIHRPSLLPHTHTSKSMQEKKRAAQRAARQEEDGDGTSERRKEPAGWAGQAKKKDKVSHSLTVHSSCLTSSRRRNPLT